MALLTLSPQNGDYAGSATGWDRYGWDGYGLTSARLAQISQIGYAVRPDNGLYQQRNDSFGYTSSQYQNNTLIGSLMCGGPTAGLGWSTSASVRS